MKNDFDIKVDVSENAVLVNDMEKWVINRRMIKKVILGQLGMILMIKLLLIEFRNFKMSDYFKTDI